MLAVLLALAQAAPAVPATTASASPRTLSGRFACGPRVYEIAVTAVPAAPGTQVSLDRLTVDGRALDPIHFVEPVRLIARLRDVRSIDLRCVADGGEVSLYGIDADARRARVRGRITPGGVRDLGYSVEQARR